LHIVLSLLNAKDGVLLIDEMENGLHYRIQENLWRIIFEFSTKLNIQVFVTTHSWDVIESFSKISVEHPEEGVLYRLGRSRFDGKLSSYRYSEQALQSATQSEMEVR
jgi:AAA15 family ATPase/GTPase